MALETIREAPYVVVNICIVFGQVSSGNIEDGTYFENNGDPVILIFVSPV